MLNQKILIILIVVIIAVLAYDSMTQIEGYCNCKGMGTKLKKPTYFVYRPEGDVSNYTLAPENTMTTNSSSSFASANLGWGTGMPKEPIPATDSWTAGSNPNPCNQSSVPMATLETIGGHLPTPSKRNESRSPAYINHYGAAPVFDPLHKKNMYSSNLNVPSSNIPDLGVGVL